jgi:hypothetical protein
MVRAARAKRRIGSSRSAASGEESGGSGGAGSDLSPSTWPAGARYTIFIAALFLALGRRPRFSGFFLGLFMLVYAPFRFSVDFLRIVDVRYGGLTPGQYGCVALALGGVVVLVARSRVDRSDSSP